MKLEDLLSQHSPIRLARKQDSHKLMEYFTSLPMDTVSSLQLTYLREPDFFTFLNYQSDDHFIFCLQDSDSGELIGVGSLVIREAYIDGELKRLGYLADLRVNITRKTIRYARTWKDYMGQLIKEIKNIDEFRCDCLVTAVMGDNSKAKNSLVHKNRNEFQYHKLANYRSVNILTTLGKQKRLKNVNLQRCKPCEEEELLDFLKTEYQYKQFGYTESFIRRALKTWHDFSIENFVLAREVKTNQIIGCFASWNPSPVKKIVFTRLPWSLKFLNFIASMITYAPSEGNELEIQYMNFLNITKGNEQLIGNFIDYLKNEDVFKNFHLLAFADFDSRPLRGYIKRALIDETPLELYQVIHKSMLDELITLKEGELPAFEMSLV